MAKKKAKRTLRTVKKKKSRAALPTSATGNRLAKKTPRTSAILTGKVPKRAQPLQARKRAYDPTKHSAPRSFIPPDDQIIRRDRNVSVQRPKFINRPGPLICRPLPAFNPEDPTKWDDYKLGHGVYSFGEWLRRIPVAKYVGDKEAYSFIRYDPRMVPEGEDPRALGLDPYEVLYGALYRRVKNEPEKVKHKSWFRLFADNRPVFSRPTFLFLLQAVIYMNDRKIYFTEGKVPLGFGPRDMTQVVELPHSAGEDLVDKLNVEKADYEGDPADWHNKLKWGDVVNPNTGVFLSIYNPKAWQPPTKRKKQQFSDDYRDAQAGDAGDRKDPFELAGFRTHVSRKLIHDGMNTGLSPRLQDHQVEVVVDKIQPWEDILRYPESPDEPCLHIAKALRNFEDGKRVLSFGWADHPEFLTAEVRKIMAHSKSVSVKSHLPSAEDEDEDMGNTMDAWNEQQPTDSRKKKKRSGKKKSRRPPAEPEYEEESEAEATGEDTEYEEEPEAEATGKDAEYTEYEESEGEDEDEESEGEDEDEESEGEDEDEESEDEDEDEESEDEDEESEGEESEGEDEDEDEESEDEDEDEESVGEEEEDESEDEESGGEESEDEDYDENDYDEDEDEESEGEEEEEEEDESEGEEDEYTDEDEGEEDESEGEEEESSDEMEAALAAVDRSSARSKKQPLKKKVAKKAPPAKKQARSKTTVKKKSSKKSGNK